MTSRIRAATILLRRKGFSPRFSGKLLRIVDEMTVVGSTAFTLKLGISASFYWDQETNIKLTEENSLRVTFL